MPRGWEPERKRAEGRGKREVGSRKSGLRGYDEVNDWFRVRNFQILFYLFECEWGPQSQLANNWNKHRLWMYVCVCVFMCVSVCERKLTSSRRNAGKSNAIQVENAKPKGRAERGSSIDCTAQWCKVNKRSKSRQTLNTIHKRYRAGKNIEKIRMLYH